MLTEKSIIKLKSKPLVLFDVHGVLLETSWDMEMKTVYQHLVKSRSTRKQRQWIEENYFKKSPARIESLAKLTGKPFLQVKKTVDIIRKYSHTQLIPKKLPHVVRLLAALKKRQITMLAVCGAQQKILLKQLRANRMLDYIPANHIIGLDEKPAGSIKKREQLFRWIKQLTGGRFIYFNDWSDGNLLVKTLGGKVIGIADHRVERYPIYYKMFRRTGVKHIFKGWSKWQEILGIVDKRVK